MVNDTNFLPATILKPRPTRAQFERDFVNAKVDDDLYETARKNTSYESEKSYTYLAYHLMEEKPLVLL